jgi:aspartate racemase
MPESANKLAGMGAQFLICPDNTIHQALPYVVPRSPLPWLHIADAVMAEARARGFRRVGLTGTRWLTDGPVYPAELVRPVPEEREEINRIIMDELVYGVCKPSSLQYFQKIMQKMKGAGCDAVVLGCTEIPLVMNDANAGLPTLDSTRLLARAALRRSLQDG